MTGGGADRGPMWEDTPLYTQLTHIPFPLDIHRSTLYNIHMKHSHIITVRVSSEMLAYLKRVSKGEDRSMSYVIRRLLREDMDGTQGSESVRREVQE